MTMPDPDLPELLDTSEGSDPERASEVEVLFIEDAPDRTRVQLVHSRLDRHGDGWEQFREGLASHDAWPLYLQRYVDLVPTR